MRPFIMFAILAAASLACQDTLGPTDDSLPSDASSRIAANQAADVASLDLRKERASLIAAGNGLSRAIQQQGVVQGLGSAFGDHVIFLSPRKPIVWGSDAARNFLSHNSQAPTAMRWSVLIAQVSANARQGYTWARGFFTIDFGTGASEQPGFFLIYWRRESDAWRVAAFVFNLRAPGPVEIPAGFGTPTDPHGRSFPTDVDKERRNLLATDAAFSAASVRNSSGPAFEHFAARNAIGVGNGHFVFGPEAIGEAFSVGPDDQISWIPRQSGVAATGDLGFTVGEATFVFKDFGTFFSKYLTVWQKQSSGKWRFVADFGSSRPGP
jgi:hypothetical protein